MGWKRINWAPTETDIFRATTFVFSDPGPRDGRADILYLFGNTPDYETPILDKGCELYKAGYSPLIGICGGEIYAPHNVNAYSGASVWKKYLTANGVPASAIVEIPRPELSHTGTEAENLLYFAQSRRWTKLIITCSAHQQLRGFVLTISIVLRMGALIRIYNKPGKPFAWFEKAVISQGEENGIRFEKGLFAEWDRLNRIYNNQYDPLPYEQFKQYLMWRDDALE